MTLHTKTILHDLWVHCPRCAGPAHPDTPNIHCCGSCNGTGKIFFRPNCMLFLDQDGVSADFDLGCKQMTGKWPKEHESDEAMWAAIHKVKDFFANLPMVEGFAEFYEWVRPLGPMILTACPPTRYVEVAEQKKAWRTKNIPGKPYLLPCQGGRNKHLFMHNVGDILIDDFGKNITAWEEHGGVGIKHELTNWDDTKARLVSILIDKYHHRQ